MEIPTFRKATKDNGTTEARHCPVAMVSTRLPWFSVILWQGQWWLATHQSTLTWSDLLVFESQALILVKIGIFTNPHLQECGCWISNHEQMWMLL